MKSIDPSTDELIQEYAVHGPAEVEARLIRAVEAQAAWALRTPAERAPALALLAQGLEARREGLAELMAREMGKPLGEGRGEVDKCAWVARYYAEEGPDFLRPEPIETDAARSLVAYEPLGVVLAIMPWNFPLWQVVRFAAPALLAGNGALLKHAPNVQGCAEALEALFGDLGLPAGLFANLRIEHDAVPGLLGDPRVAAVTLTGSERAGRAVAAQAGAALKKAVLELGGNDAYLVLADADLDLAVKECVTSRLINNGQSCIAAKRLLVAAPVRREFEERLVEAFRAARVGSPLDGEVQLGPMARRDLRDTLHGQVQASVEAGAKLLLGGEPPPGPGAFYPPTVLSGVAPGMPAFDDELFGPVAAVVEIRDADHGVELANASRFGLGAAVFTRDPARGEELAGRLRAGSTFVNAFVRSDPRLPFGGIKCSGFGRELSRLGLHEFVNAKTVYVAG